MSNGRKFPPHVVQLIILGPLDLNTMKGAHHAGMSNDRLPSSYFSHNLRSAVLTQHEGSTLCCMSIAKSHQLHINHNLMSAVPTQDEKSSLEGSQMSESC